MLLIDNHSSHLDSGVIGLAKENGVVMRSFPPHCSHRLQQLERSVYGPFKRLLATQHDSWMRSNACKVMTIFDFPGIVKEVWPRAASPGSATSGFKSCRIFPYCPDIFTESDFAPSQLIDDQSTTRRGRALKGNG